ncbi:unnamed protein product [Closterium sp. NIES-54]
MDADDDDESCGPVQKSPPRTALSFLRPAAQPVLESPAQPFESTEYVTAANEAALGVSNSMQYPEPQDPATLETKGVVDDKSFAKRKRVTDPVWQKWRQPKLSFTRDATPTVFVEDAIDDEEDDDELHPAEEICEIPEVAFARAHRSFQSSWNGLFPWLVLLRTDDGMPILKCSWCMEHGSKSANTAYGKGGTGGQDMQKASIRTHQRSTPHLDATATMKSKERRKLWQSLLSEFEGLDRSTRHLITALKTAVLSCQSEAPITSYIGFIKFMVDIGLSNLPLDKKGSYFSKKGS